VSRTAVRVRLLVAMGAALALLSAASALPVPAPRTALTVQEELLFFPSGTLLRPASLGYETLAADLCWLRAIQYYGRHRLTDRVYTGADHVFSVIARLDPHFVSNYIFGAIVLAQDAGDPDASLALLDRGMHATPGAWEIPFEAGFIEYLIRRDVAAAAPHFRRAAAYADDPDLARRFAAWSAYRAGDVDAAVRLWRDMAETSDNATVRATAENYLRRLHQEGGGR
jgi:tetratricopeptide (TPR) repeat protein